MQPKKTFDVAKVLHGAGRLVIQNQGRAGKREVCCLLRLSNVLRKGESWEERKEAKALCRTGIQSPQQLEGEERRKAVSSAAWLKRKAVSPVRPGEIN